ncbi:uroporphyrinogen-III synthase [Lysinibacter sp. HNR]|uniref:uroporphyrinogen-III synthase n=1 Tax=Lysinibacter sp. HNR TaxID=3031408 RepID=UPI002434BE4A|nr:uroporphyrinogen-III synthase [Lysinibacter sp. HNR]WGD37652.1 uroporphyrinogen-III synthase [Lysinibacter sp. HNR]
MTELKTLSGWRILVPRGGPWGDRVAASLRNYGAQPVIAPLINFAPTDEAESLRVALDRLAAGEFAWITATSATVVDVLAHHNVVIPPHTKVAAVGETTAAAFTAAGYTVDITPVAENSTYGLLNEWHEVRESPSLKILTLRSNTAVPVLTKGLLALGHDVTQVVAFRTVGVPVAERVRQDVSSGRINALLITSGSVAEQVRLQFPELPEGTLLACVGPQTKKDAEAQGLRIDVVADERTTESLVNAVASVADTDSEY